MFAEKASQANAIKQLPLSTKQILKQTYKHTGTIEIWRLCHAGRQLFIIIIY